ncbi:MAG TPA: ATP-binding cassette domain-containing protein [Candidatus Saccharimonadales bacterium]|nr:ATP-binding cassette domain-containing protein [Candidatus Saccharimonadales bacterium]
MSKFAFDVTDTAKYFGDVKALDGVSLRAEEGKIFGLLGPNGAGKTTLVRILSTLTEPTRGTAKVLDVDVTENPVKVRRLIGLAGQFAAVDEFLTGRENITMVGNLYHLPKAEIKKRTEDLLERLNLADAAGRPVKTYSGGMRRRLDLGASLVGHPKVLFLDEPTTGLDPRTRLELWSIIRELVAEGTSILLTTQYLEEADELADKIAVIDRGKVIAEGTSDQLKRRLGGDVIEFQLSDLKDKDKAMAAVSTIGTPAFNDDTLSINLPVKDGSAVLTDVVRALDSAKINPASLSLHRPSLDDVFLTLTGKKAEVAEPAQKRHRKEKGNV